MMISDRIEVACSGEWLRLVFSMASMESMESIMRISVSFSVAMSIFHPCVLCIECAARVCAELIQPMVRGGRLLNWAFVKLSWCHLRHNQRFRCEYKHHRLWIPGGWVCIVLLDSSTWPSRAVGMATRDRGDILWICRLIGMC